jgi:3-deoxy-D-manno-octulosonate 8-phosphate phosphatase (KDO 8-P phosphatase)
VAQRDAEMSRPIRFILSDVDGVMTDGSIVLDNSGVETKTFNVRDGLAVKLWQQSGFQFGILTSRNSRIVKLRAAELGISIVRQGFEEKLVAAREIFAAASVRPEEVCYIGDDLPDIPVLNEVGLSATVSDAVQEVRSICKWVLQTPGGRGALRELIERLLKAKGRWEDCIPR